jgi:hypothetical protein
MWQKITYKRKWRVGERVVGRISGVEAREGAQISFVCNFSPHIARKSLTNVIWWLGRREQSEGVGSVATVGVVVLVGSVCGRC